MAFQFLCPQGHLLQADPSQMGRTINCPTCGVLFVVPSLTVAPAVQAVPVTPVPPAAQAPEEQIEDDLLDVKVRRRSRRRLDFLEELAGEEPVAEQPAQESSEEVVVELPAAAAAAFDPTAFGPKLVHIDCPRGHELITPLDTMGQDVMCPHCGEQFRLRYDHTREYLTEHHRNQEVQEEKLGRKWLTWAIVAGVMVLVMLAGMIVYSYLSR